MAFPIAGRCGSNIILDGSLGTSGPLTGPNYIIPASVGKQVGSNLFQSFSQFNLTSSESATFTGTGSTGSITNIIARVTNGSPSSIDGIINSDIAGANLFFLNPAGVMFGANAQVNVTGAFTVSTASYVKFSDGGIFNTSLGGSDVLSSAPISAFGFLNATPAPVSFSGTQLTNSGGINVVAGNITLDENTVLAAPSGNLTLFSAASVGEVTYSATSPGSGFATATNTSFGTITMQNGSSASIDGAGGGSMVIRGGQLVVNNSTVTSNNSGATTGGNISVQAETLTLENGGQIESSTTAAGQAGDISVQAGSVAISNQSAANATVETGIFSNSELTATGGSGAIDVNVTGDLQLTYGGRIANTTYSTSVTGQGGVLDVTALTLEMSGDSIATNNATNSGIFSEAHGAAAGGALTVSVTDAISITSAAAISTSTYAGGNAGAMSVSAASLAIDGNTSPGKSAPTGLFANAVAGSTGDAGTLDVNVSGAITMQQKARIAAKASGTGGAGGISVTAGSMTIEGASSITAASEGTSPATGGTITIDITGGGELDMETGGSIQTSNYTSGNAGTIAISAGSISINGLATPTGLLTGISSNAGQAGVASTATGNAGDIGLTVSGAVDLTNGGIIETNTYNVAGNAGQITVNAGSLTIDGTGTTPGATTISSSAGESGETSISTASAGQISLTVSGEVDILNGGSVQTNTFTNGNGGGISVGAGSLVIDGSGALTGSSGVTGFSSNAGDAATTTGTGNAGDITLEISGSASLTDTGTVQTNTYNASGNAGDIALTAGSLTIDGTGSMAGSTGIASNAGASGVASTATGNAGAISLTINGAMSITNTGIIQTNTYTNGNAGSLSLTSTGAVTIDSGGLIETNTYSSGLGGNLTLNAASLAIDGTGVATTATTGTGIFSNSEAGATGASGALTVDVTGELDLTNGGHISGTTLSTSAGGTGSDITVTAETISISGTSIADNSADNSGIFGETYGAAHSGTMQVTATGALTLLDYGAISTSTFGAGQAGDLTVVAGSITLNGYTSAGAAVVPTGFFANTGVGSTGQAGDLVVDVTGGGAISMLNDGRIAAKTLGKGDGGNVTVTAGTLSIDSGSFISATSAPVANSAATAGNITVNVTGLLSITDGGSIITDTSTNGNAGTVNVTAGTLVIDGSADPTALTGISSNSADGRGQTPTTGNAGTIDVTVEGAMSITGDGEISASTNNAGSGGDITVTADSLSLTGDTTPPVAGATPDFTGITAETFGSGDAGKITVGITDGLVISGDAAIETSTKGIGNAGAIVVNAESAQLDGEASASITSYRSGIISISYSPPGTDIYGNAGTINVTVAGSLEIESGAAISAQTFSQGMGGDVYVQANTLTIQGLGASSVNATGIFAGTRSSGAGGQVTISVNDLLSLSDGGSIASSSTSTTPGSAGAAGEVTIVSGGDIDLDASEITSSSLDSNAGSVTITAAGTLSLTNGSSINTSSAGNMGGNITLHVGGLVYLLNSNITSEDSGMSGSNGGNIRIDPLFVVLDNSYISANDPLGTGGNIQILSSFLFNPDDSITATGATDGTVTTPPPDLNLAASLIVQPADLEKADKQLRESCASSLNHEASSFIVVGRGGAEASPGELQPDFGTGSPLIPVASPGAKIP